MAFFIVPEGIRGDADRFPSGTCSALESLMARIARTLAEDSGASPQAWAAALEIAARVLSPELTREDLKLPEGRGAMAEAYRLWWNQQAYPDADFLVARGVDVFGKDEEGQYRPRTDLDIAVFRREHTQLRLMRMESVKASPDRAISAYTQTRYGLQAVTPEADVWLRLRSKDQAQVGADVSLVQEADVSHIERLTAGPAPLIHTRRRMPYQLHTPVRPVLDQLTERAAPLVNARVAKKAEPRRDLAQSLLRVVSPGARPNLNTLVPGAACAD